MLALSHLAKEYYNNNTVTIGYIAETEMIPQRFLEGILLKLKNAGFLASNRGKKGGYILAKSPEEVILYDVLILFEGSISLLACVCNETYQSCEFCRDESKCPIRKPFSKIYKYAIDVLKQTTLKDFIEQ